MVDEFLDAVTQARIAYDRELAKLDAEMKYRKQQAKLPVMEALKDAVQSGRSMNSIAVKGMGYASPGMSALKAFLGAAGTSRELILAALGSDTTSGSAATGSFEAPLKYEFHKDSRASHDLFYVDDEAGKRQKVYGTLFDGIVKFPDTEDREAIVRAFKAKFGDKYKYSEEDSAL